jgi:hypothetical protein
VKTQRRTVGQGTTTKPIHNLVQKLAVMLAIAYASFTSVFAAPVSIGGDIFILVVTNNSGVQLFGLASDDQGNIYAGNNSNGAGIPLQKFQPQSYTNSPVQFQNFGPVCNDGEGLAFAGGFLYVADEFSGLQKISVTNGTGSTFLPNSGKNATGSPLVVRASDRHLFVGYGAGGVPRIDEFNAAGVFVTNHTTAAEVETMIFNPATGLIYYAPFGSTVRSYNPSNRTDTLIANINGTIDGALAFDSISQRIFVGTANGANQGRVYTIDPVSGSVALFATGFQGSLGIMREPLSGDLYFLERQNLYRLKSAGVVFSPKLFIWTAIELGWISDTNQTYQVQWSTNLSSSNWVNFGTTIQGNGTTNFLFDTTRTSPQRFYRVIVVQ